MQLSGKTKKVIALIVAGIAVMELAPGLILPALAIGFWAFWAKYGEPAEVEESYEWPESSFDFKSVTVDPDPFDLNFHNNPDALGSSAWNASHSLHDHSRTLPENT